MIFTERGGRISIYDGEKRMVVETIEVSEVAESGLLGIAVDPEFETNRYIYTYHTHPNGFNRVSRFTLENDRMEEEAVLLDNIPSAQFHDGGRIKFGPDSKLYVTTGDATQPSSAQNINSLAGKILRMNKDGSVPEDNPYDNYVWSYGHRNPQGLAWKNNILYESEHGPSRNDEINIITKGGNYGWPNDCTEEGDFNMPIRCYTEFTLAPSAIALYGDHLYVSGLRGTQLRKLTIKDNSISEEEEIINDLGRIREVVYHNGYIYFSTSNRDGRGIPKSNDDKIMRIEV